jgi:ribosome-binding protein aMBF1 (putative translation factor)
MDVRQYKNKMGIPRYATSKSYQEIIDFKRENPQMSNQEIANHFGVSKNTIQTATSGMPGRKY